MRERITPRSLVGMTMSARKRRARRFGPRLGSFVRLELIACGIKPAVAYNMINGIGIDPELYAEALSAGQARWLAHRKHYYRLDERRLRPCPGCVACGHRRFRAVGGFGDSTDHVHWTGKASYLVRKRWEPGRFTNWKPRTKRRVTAPHHPLARCLELVSSGEWEQVPDKLGCDGDGLVRYVYFTEPQRFVVISGVLHP